MLSLSFFTGTMGTKKQRLPWELTGTNHWLVANPFLTKLPEQSAVTGSHATNKDTGAQRGCVSCPRSHSQGGAE